MQDALRALQRQWMHYKVRALLLKLSCAVSWTLHAHDTVVFLGVEKSWNFVASFGDHKKGRCWTSFGTSLQGTRRASFVAQVTIWFCVGRFPFSASSTTSSSTGSHSWQSKSVSADDAIAILALRQFCPPKVELHLYLARIGLVTSNVQR